MFFLFYFWQRILNLLLTFCHLLPSPNLTMPPVDLDIAPLRRPSHQQENFGHFMGRADATLIGLYPND